MVQATDVHKADPGGFVAVPGRLILVGGGVRSGKSRFAVDYARTLGQRRVFLATAEAGDEEMQERIARHRAERADDFVTLEQPCALAPTLNEIRDTDVVVVDCLTLWLANLLLRESPGPGDPEHAIAERVEALLAVLRQRRFHVVLVSNEVGMGIVPPTHLGRVFRDIAGRTHQRVAAEADEVYFATMGLVLRLSPGPLASFPPGRLP